MEVIRFINGGGGDGVATKYTPIQICIYPFIHT